MKYLLIAVFWVVMVTLTITPDAHAQNPQVGDDCTGLANGATALTFDTDWDRRDVVIVCDGTNWVAMGSGGDNLGNHTATSNLDMADKAITSSAGTIRDADGGWVRTYGNTGWYNGTHGGGWYMSDSSWIRAHSGKGVYTQGQIYTTDRVRANDGFQVDGTLVIDGGGRFQGRLDIYPKNALTTSSGYCLSCNSGDQIVGGYISGLDECNGGATCDADATIDTPNNRMCAGANDHTGYRLHIICINVP